MGFRPGSRVRSAQRGRTGQLVQGWLNPNILALSPWIWLDASDASTITESSGFVSQWNDKSGNGRDLSQGTGINQPTIGTVTLNGLNTITFDGSNDRLSRSASGLFPNTTSLSFFVVMRPGGVPNLAPRIFDVANRTGQYLSPGYAVLAVQYSSTALSIRSADNSIPTGQWSKCGYVWKGSAQFSEGSIRVNESELSPSGTNGSGSLTNSGATDFHLGNRAANDRAFQGEIAEFILFTRDLALSESLLIEQYLERKWGV